MRAVWPGSSLHYRGVLASNRWEDFEWKYSGNRFSYWGPPGLSKMETLTKSIDRDYAYYMESHDPLPLEAYYLAAKGLSGRNLISKSFRKDCEETASGNESEGVLIESSSVVSDQRSLEV